MERELKFIISDKTTFEKLLRIKTLCNYPISACRTSKLYNYYLDTEDRKLLQSGLFLRKRKEGNNYILTLKSEELFGGEIHRRQEIECQIANNLPFRLWPECELTHRVKSIIKDSCLELLFDSITLRRSRTLFVDGREFAKIAIDKVQMSITGQKIDFMELEIELISGQSEKLLSKLSAMVMREFRLKHESRSKFIRGLEFADKVKDAAKQVNSYSTIRQLFKKFHVETEHACCVASNAVKLFDLLRPQHNLGDKEKRLLETAGKLHDIGYSVNPEKHHVIGRDILFESRVEGLDAVEQKMLAWVVFLHGGWHSMKSIKAVPAKGMYRFSASRKETVCNLGAILRLADGLDFSRSGSEIIGMIPGRKKIIFEICGKEAVMDARRAEKKADLWYLIYNVQLKFKAEIKQSDSHRQEKSDSLFIHSRLPGILKEDTLSQAARKILQYQFEAMLRNEYATVGGRNRESLHDMRVASMRLRTAYEVFQEFLGKDVCRQLHGIKATRRVLAPVRDRDVLIQDVKAYPSVAEGKKTSMKPVIDAIQRQRQGWLSQMDAYLKSCHYSRFKKCFEEALLDEKAWDARNESANKGLPVQLVQDFLPVIIYKQLAFVTAYDKFIKPRFDISMKDMHQLRIKLKQLRYTLEFFREILGPEQKKLIKNIKSVQEHLGLINDGIIALPMLELAIEKALADGRRVKTLKRYLSYRKRNLRRLYSTFPKTWKGFLNRETKDELALSLTSAME